MSKYHQKDSEIYYDDTDIPKNKLSLTNSEELHEIEASLLEDGYELFISELDQNTIFNEDYFISLHRRTFESLYDWAGLYRTEDMFKGDSVFCVGRAVKAESKKIFERIKGENYFKEFDTISKAEFAKKLALIKSDIITLHPFYELNGRITRLFFDLIVIYNGYQPIDYSNYTPDDYINASIDCVKYADETFMEKIILDGLIKQ
ncbi:Fic/DOC family protein [Halarcobacter sp.]|uniref:Fic/DOC family protein n=1 Tax=Halarcobacter sp. TaxID=2321133 RepID=UPI003A94B538